MERLRGKMEEGRKLASIQQIVSIDPIPERDRIELAHVLGWQVIVKKDEFQAGDLCIFVEPDALMPEKPEFEFLRAKKFRIKTMKMAGVLSQGICFPMSMLPDRKEGYKVGDDVTDILGIVKYDEYGEQEESEKEDKRIMKKYPSWLMRWAWFRKLVLPSRKKQRGFPSFIRRTDETRIQVIPDLLKDKRPFAVTEKLDGCSMTAALVKTRTWYGKPTYEFILCSRTLRLWNDDGNHYWQACKKYTLPQTLKSILDDELLCKGHDKSWIAVQGEVIGPKIQKNPYELKTIDFYVFNVIFPDGRVDPLKTQTICKSHGLKPVPLLIGSYVLPDTVNEMLEFATGKSVLNESVMREGFVLRSLDGKISFKAVSPDYLIKHGG